MFATSCQLPTGRVFQQPARAELIGLCGCSDIGDAFFISLFSRSEPPAKDLRDERYKDIITFISNNARLQTDREDSAVRHYWDGFADYEDNLVFRKAWELAEHVPVNTPWAIILGRLFARLGDVHPSGGNWGRPAV
jgi:hypothetical protein